MSKTPKELNFEEAMAELEEITQKLEEGKESLELSMELYERGMVLKTFCENKLKEAEGKWMALKKNKSGEIVAEEISAETAGTFEADDENGGAGQRNMF